MPATTMNRHARHTPGPWKNAGQFIVAPDPRGVHPDIYIAEIVQENEEGRLASPAQRRANGQLIAAAPRMLAALQRGLKAGTIVADSWERGDLAQAVRMLSLWLADASSAIEACSARRAEP